MTILLNKKQNNHYVDEVTSVRETTDEDAILAAETLPSAQTNRGRS